MDGAMQERQLTSAKQCSTWPAAALYDANKRSTPISPAMQLIEKVLTNELGVGGGRVGRAAAPTDTRRPRRAPSVKLVLRVRNLNLGGLF